MENKKIIFIHINKCGGTSMKHIARGYGHIKIPNNDDIISLKNKNSWNESIKITFVRNPYTRLLSLYHMLKRDGYQSTLDEIINIITNKNIKYLVSDGGLKPGGTININGFTSGGGTYTYITRSKEYIRRHGLPMTHKHYGVVNDDLSLDIDYVYKLEELQDKWGEIKQITQINKDLVKLNVSKNKNEITVFTKEQLSKINEYYHNDFICFNYEKIE